MKTKQQCNFTTQSLLAQNQTQYCSYRACISAGKQLKPSSQPLAPQALSSTSSKPHENPPLPSPFNPFGSVPHRVVENMHPLPTQSCVAHSAIEMEQIPV